MGDLGRSPRMLYHVLELADAGAGVDLVGYEGRELPLQISDHPGVRCHRLKDSDPAWRRNLPRPLFAIHAAWRMMILAWRLIFRLLRGVERPDFFLVQTPPAVPGLFVVWVASRLRRALLVIDWHNFSYSMLGMQLGQGYWLVRMARRMETFLARRGDVHFCVSNAMQRTLTNEWGLEDVHRLYDLPRTLPEPFTNEERQSLLSSIAGELAQAAGSTPSNERTWQKTPGTALAVSATSWSSDEDFELLLQALPQLDALFVKQSRANGETPMQRLDVLITGDGPGRAAFEAAAARRSFSTIRVATTWVSAEMFPRLLAAADVGLCLHRSTSGEDLPMKVIDMLGAGLPVCALDYGGALSERLNGGENAILFRTAESLAQALFELLGDHPDRPERLEALRRNIHRHPLPNWRQEWRRVAGPVFFAPGCGVVSVPGSPLT